GTAKDVGQLPELSAAAAGTAAADAGSGAKLGPDDAGAKESRQERCDAEVAAVAAATTACDSAATWCAEEHAGVGAESASERSEFYAWHERRRQVHAAGFEPPARWRRAGAAKRISSFQIPFPRQFGALTRSRKTRHRDYSHSIASNSMRSRVWPRATPPHRCNNHPTVRAFPRRAFAH